MVWVVFGVAGLVVFEGCLGIQRWFSHLKGLVFLHTSTLAISNRGGFRGAPTGGHEAASKKMFS